jgi:hypothetical protein
MVVSSPVARVFSHGCLRSDGSLWLIARYHSLTRVLPLECGTLWRAFSPTGVCAPTAHYKVVSSIDPWPAPVRWCPDLGWPAGQLCSLFSIGPLRQYGRLALVDARAFDESLAVLGSRCLSGHVHDKGPRLFLVSYFVVPACWSSVCFIDQWPALCP